MLSSLLKVKKIMNGFDHTVLVVPIELITTLYTVRCKINNSSDNVLSLSRTKASV